MHRLVRLAMLAGALAAVLPAGPAAAEPAATPLAAVPAATPSAAVPAATPSAAVPVYAAAATRTSLAQVGSPGYWMLDAAGSVYGFGSGAGTTTGADGSAVAIASAQNGYWLLRSDGVVVAVGGLQHFGDVDTSKLRRGESVRSIVGRLDGTGYWVFTDRGQAFAFGSAPFRGDMRDTPLNGSIIASAVTATGNGYWMVGSDGGIFSFGDAAFAGSMGGQRLNAPVVGIAPDPDGVGYWLVASDGGIFAFDAEFRGSLPGVLQGRPLNKPVIGALSYGDGYLMVASDGGIFSFSDQPFLGSLGANPPSSPVVGVAIRPFGSLLADPVRITSSAAGGTVRTGDVVQVAVTLRNVGDLPVTVFDLNIPLEGVDLVDARTTLVSMTPSPAPSSAWGIRTIGPRSVQEYSMRYAISYLPVAADVVDPGSGADFAWAVTGAPALRSRVTVQLRNGPVRGPWTLGPARHVDPACLGALTPGSRTAVGPGGATYTVTPTGIVTVGGGGTFAGDYSLASRAPFAPVVGIVADPDGFGYWMLHRNGSISVFGAEPRSINPLVDGCGVARFAPIGNGYAITTAAGVTTTYP